MAAAVGIGAVLAACGPAAPPEPLTEPSPAVATAAETRQVQVRHPAGYLVDLDMLAVDDPAAVAEARQAVVDQGGACPAVARLWRLSVRGAALKTLRADCQGGGLYALRVGADGVRAAPWSGALPRE